VIGGGAGPDKTRAGDGDDTGSDVIVAVVVGHGAVDGVGGGGKFERNRVVENEAGAGVGRGAIVNHGAQDGAIVVGGVDGSLDAGVLADVILDAGNVAGGEVAGETGVTGRGSDIVVKTV